MVNWTLASGTSGDVGYLPDGQVEGAFNGNGGSTWWYEQYLWVGQRLMAYYNPDWNTYFIHRGANGSSTQITNESGGLAGDMLFYPFGQEWQYDNGVNSAWWQFYNSFSRWNADLGFDLTPNRKYSPTLGRWMTPDPSGMAAASPSNPQTWNMYAYVLNNPTSLVDTSGLQGGCPEGEMSADGKCILKNPGPPQQSYVSGTDEFPAPTVNVPMPPLASPSGMPGGQGGVGGGGGGMAQIRRAPPPGPHKPADTRPSCGSVYLDALAGSNSKRMADTGKQAVEAGSFAAAAESLNYQMEKLLIMPLKSPYVRLYENASSLLAEVSEVVPLVFATYTFSRADFAVAKARIKGACRPGF